LTNIEHPHNWGSRLRALILQSNVDDARQNRVVNQLHRAGWDVTRCGFRRSYYRSDDRVSNVVLLGSMPNSGSLERIPKLIQSTSTVRRLAIDCDAVYCFGADMHLLCKIATSGLIRPVFRDIADIPRILSEDGIAARIARNVDRWSARTAAGLVVTSGAFIEEYYRPLIGKRLPESFVLENRVDAAETGPRLQSPAYAGNGPIRIGYFGLLRCQRSLQVLTAAARAAPERISVIVRGHCQIDKDTCDRAAALPNFLIGGPYRSPDDLAEIYSTCDVVWSCYPYEPANVNSRLAQTNRFYEACYFSRPQICQAGTSDAKKVIELGIGLAVDLSNIETAASEIAHLNRNQLAAMADHLGLVPENAFTYQGEARQIVEYASRFVATPR
jgi:succinoglycan biosynthesis protein ExoL